MSDGATTTTSNAEINRLQQTYLFPAVLTYYGEALPLVRGKGHKVWDADGNEYLDFFGGILTVSLGHCHDGVNERIKAQTDTLQHPSTLYPNLPQVKLAEKLARITPGRLQKSFFTSSGTEADETAVMTAKMATGGQELIVLRHGYSGRSAMATTMTAHGKWRVLGDQVLGIKHALAPYCYRCPLKLTYPECGVACAEDIEELIRTTTTGNIAGMLVEPIQGVGGFVTPPKEYFQIAAEIVRSHGGLFIADEVQTGWGRTGGKMWGIEHYGVEPDIMTMAKGAGNGVPIGITIATPEVADSWVALTISTFGGNPVSCEAARAVVDVIETDDLVTNAQVMGARLRAGLEALQEKYPLIGEVRGMGLMQGVELVKDRQTKEPATQEVNALFEATKRRHVLIGKGGLYGNVLRIAPALTVTAEGVDDFLGRLDEAFAEITG